MTVSEMALFFILVIKKSLFKNKYPLKYMFQACLVILK